MAFFIWNELRITQGRQEGREERIAG